MAQLADKLNSNKYRLPIYTLPIPWSKTYIVTSPQLIRAVMRQKTISFNPIVLEFDKLFGFSPKTTKLIWLNHDNEKVDSYARDMQRSMHGSLIEGPAVHEMKARGLRIIGKELNSIGREVETKLLLPWLRDIVTVASSDALFGSNHIFAKDRRLIDAYW